jgi:hypothetical protein
MSILLGLALLAQVLTAPQAYTTGDIDQLGLATLNGRYSIELGQGCDDIGPGVNVELLPGSGGVAAIAPIGSDQVCNVLIDERTSDEPCAQNSDGDCDVAAEPSAE